MLLLQEFDVNIQHQPRVQHAIANYLSHLKSRELAETEYNEFPDDSLFSLDATTLFADHEDEWIMEMTQFLNTNFPPEHLTLDTKKRLAV